MIMLIKGRHRKGLIFSVGCCVHFRRRAEPEMTDAAIGAPNLGKSLNLFLSTWLFFFCWLLRFEKDTSRSDGRNA